jgi:anti-sigma B factor antagonist
MNIDVALHPNGVAVVHLAGYLDPRVVTTLKHRLAALIGSGHPRLVVDLALVTFMNSGGLGLLIEGCKSARLAGGDLRLARPNEQARAVLRLTLLNQYLQSFDTVEEAQASFERQSDG